MTLGNKIQELRKSRSLSQEAFAEIMGVTRQSVSKWELDQSYPALDKLVEIADFFNISLDEMLRNEGNSSVAANDCQENGKDVHRVKDNKEQLWYFIWFAFMAVIMMILFGVKEYFAGFIASQILVWISVVIRIYSYIKKKRMKLQSSTGNR